MFCRICLEEGGELIHPCRCSGTMKYVHPHCMQQWFYQNIDITRCEICHHPFTFKTHKTVLQRIITKLSDVLLMEVYVCFYYLIIYIGSLLFTICGLDCHILDDCELRASYIAYSAPQYLFQVVEILQRENRRVCPLSMITFIYGNTIFLSLVWTGVPMWITMFICLIMTRFNLEISRTTIPKPQLQNYESVAVV